MSYQGHQVCTTLCLKKTSPMFLAITHESIVEFSYLAETVLRKHTITRCYIFPPHLINASAIPCETKNTAIVSYYVNVSCWFTNRHTRHTRFIT